MLKSKLIFLTSLAWLIGCTAVKAPVGSVPKRTDLSIDAYGGWMEVQLLSTNTSRSGEFIAISNDTIYLMPSEKVVKYAVSDISTARIIYFNTETDSYNNWTRIVSVSTLTNGLFLIFTLPLALSTGISTTNAEADRVNYVDYPATSIDELKKYARFPQGMPREVTLDMLKPRAIVKN